MDNTYKSLIFDEKLLRLLYYPPQDLLSGTPDPLSETPQTPNIVDTSTPQSTRRMWTIINKHILNTSKSDDLETEHLARVYIYAGKARRSLGNSSTLRQEIVADVFVHSIYEEDYRMEAISDRLGQLLVHERPDGMGKIDYRDGYDFVAPKEYRAYRHIYETVRTRK